MTNTSRARPPLAHTGYGGHPLDVHLREVARRGREHAAAFGLAELAWWAGLWHDVGKYHPAFQQYLCDAEAGLARRGPDHKAAGATLALRHCQPLAHPIVGHHGGLRDTDGEHGLRGWLAERTKTPEVHDALALARAALAGLEPTEPVALPPWVRDELTAELATRMVFSALVDADFLDTEAHLQRDKADVRGGSPDIATLWETLERYQTANTGLGTDPVNVARDEVYRACLAAGPQPQGFFRLTVPTGGGKTRSGLAFALRHALAHGLRRVIVAIPYTSITDQTAEVYRTIFAGHPRAVLEHHSAMQRPEDPAAPHHRWEDLAAENWDAPIVVTTTVQLFESLLGCSTSACRKVHNIAGSVIILDEVQTLPEHLLDPLLSVLRELVAHYRVTVVLSTATQPALDDRQGFGGLPGVREIVPDPDRYFVRLQRVEYVTVAEPWSWERAADELLDGAQGMAIVNTKRDALALLDALEAKGAEGLFHLSTNLCAAHRREVLADVRRRLAAGAPCRLVATQVVEAGVDLDFPTVLRAVGPLDRIVQAAGRCNREGRRDFGRVVVFQPAEGGLPTGAYRTGASLAAAMLAAGTFDLHDPATYLRYFADLFARVDRDSKRVQELRRRMRFRSVAEVARLIDEESVSLIVRYWEALPDGEPVDQALWRLRDRRGNPRELWRALQPLMLGVRAYALRQYERTGLAWEVVPGLWEWKGGYDRTRGLVEARPDPAELVI